MVITPINPNQPIEALMQNVSAAQTDMKSPSSMFGEILKDAVDSVNQTDYAVKQEAYRIETGQSDDLHTLAINSTKAEIALMALAEVRNKAIDAYKEIMQISL